MNVNGNFFKLIQESKGYSSNTLFVSYSKPNNATRVVSKNSIYELPKELLTEISSYLKPDIQNIFRLTSKKFNEIILNNAKRAEINLIRFSDLMGNVDLDNLAKKISDSNDLSEILSLAYKLKESVVNLFNKLKKDETDLLEKSAIDKKLPGYFKSIMELEGITTRLNEINSWQDTYNKFQKIESKIRKLLKNGNGNIDKSLITSKKILDSYVRSNILVDIIEALVSKGHFKRGLNITKKMVHCTNRSRTLVKIALEYVNEGDNIKALEVEKQILEVGENIKGHYSNRSVYTACQEVIFSAVSLGFAKKGDGANAVLMTIRIPSETKRILVIDRINEIAKMQPDELCHYQPRQDTHLITATYGNGLFLP